MATIVSQYRPKQRQRGFFHEYGQSIEQYRRVYKLKLAREALKQGDVAVQTAGYLNQ